MKETPKRLNLLEWIVSMFLMVVVVINCWNVIGRYFFNKPIYWSDELSTLLLVWIVFLGGAVAIASNALMGIDYFFNKRSVRWRKSMQVVGGVIVIAALLYITIYAAEVTFILNNQELASLPISRAWSFAPIPIGCAIMICYITSNIIKYLRKTGD